jgi:hypothetical protein
MFVEHVYVKQLYDKRLFVVKTQTERTSGAGTNHGERTDV